MIGRVDVTPVAAWREALVSGRVTPLRALVRQLPDGLPAHPFLEGTPLLAVVLDLEHSARATDVRRSAAAHRHQLDFLLQSGASPLTRLTTPYSTGLSPLLMACGLGSQASVERLVEAGAPLNTDQTGATTALHQAVLSGNVRLVRWLVAQGAALEAVDVEGRTPLHLAAEGAPRGLLNVLHEAGADWTARDSRRRTPLDVIALTNPVLADWWRHRPGQERLEHAVPAATAPIAPRRRF